MKRAVAGLLPRPASTASGCWAKWCSRGYNFLRLLSRPKHLAHIKQSRRILRLIRTFAGAHYEARAVSYLRKVHPNVLEEVVLSAFEDRGHVVLRNLRYSGDGGCDGHVRVDGRWWPVQVKRYSAHIDNRHVEDFVRCVEVAGLPGGFFVHTGRSGGAVYRHLGTSRVQLISGDRLLALIFDQGK